jgi:enoyl-CoA hydratase
MGELVRLEIDTGIATLVMDDGKVNALSPAMQGEVHAAMDEAENEDAVLVIRGRPGRFSAGFDLGVFQQGPEAAAEMVLGGFELARRITTYPRPVVIACTGHAIAMGAFLLLTADHRIGVDGQSRIAANEVAIGMTLPHSAAAMLHHRLTPSAAQQAALLSHEFDPQAAVRAGFLDELVAAEGLVARADEVATRLAQLDATAHRATKQRMRERMVADLTEAIARDRTEFNAR